MDTKEMERYSGESNYRRAPKLELDIIKLNGEQGLFFRVTKGLDKYENESLGDSVEGVILRVRRRLADFQSGLGTSEHNTPNDQVTLFERQPNGKSTVKDRGQSGDIRTKYKELKTEQVVYFLLGGQVVKLIVRGASLGSEGKAKDVMGFYDYLSSFGKEHVWQYSTVLKPIKETNPKLKKTYYAINFLKGEKLSEEELGGVGVEMKALHEFFEELNSYQASKEKPVTTHSAGEQPDVQKHPEEKVVQLDDSAEIKAEDLPF